MHRNTLFLLSICSAKKKSLPNMSLARYRWLEVLKQLLYRRSVNSNAWLNCLSRKAGLLRYCCCCCHGTACFIRQYRELNRSRFASIDRPIEHINFSSVGSGCIRKFMAVFYWLFMTIWRKTAAYKPISEPD